MISRKILIILGLFIAAFNTSVIAQISEREVFQSRCRSILGKNPGAILVYDLREEKFLAVINPETAFRSSYRPGSLFKLVTAAALLERNRIDPVRKDTCRNFFSLGTTKLTCSHPGGHGEIDLTNALGQSCSKYFYRHALKLKAEELGNTARMLNFGVKIPPPGLHLEPIPGVCVPPRTPARFILFSVGDDKDIKVTPWQILNFTAFLARGKPIAPARTKMTLSPRTLRFLRDGMKQAAQSGTCSSLTGAGINAAGKTGTSTNDRNPEKYHGWFAGYTPTESPRYALVVFIEDGRGYTDAVPIALKIINQLKNLPEKK